MNQQRRTFRGRGGPNDRRLPKHNARRRKPHPHQCTRPAVHAVEQSASIEENEGSPHHEDSEEGKFCFDLELGHQSLPQDDNDDDDDHRQDDQCQKEIHHLRRRIRNVQESIQTSTSLVQPSVYQEICLNAVANCVNEWRSISRHYHETPKETAATDPSSTSVGLTPELCKETGLVVFQLIQLSVQSGPLSGAKPGYFKRCGGSFAKMVETYLEDVVPAHEVLAESMGFSSKQMDAMKKWKANATKASENDKAPSKAVVKQQQQQLQRKKGKKR